MLGGDHKFFWKKVQGDAVRIKPLRNNTGSCTHVTLVTCPSGKLYCLDANDLKLSQLV